MSIFDIAREVGFAWQFAFIGAAVGYVLRRDAKITSALIRMHQELWIVGGPGLLASAVDSFHGRWPWMVAFNAWGLVSWWSLRNWPDENRWKRRGRKLKDAVAVRAGRLVVEPAS
jgi:hypothetical protein